MPPTEPGIRALYERHAHVLHLRARSILDTDEDPADAVQEAFARVIRGSAQYAHEASPLTWM